MKPFIVHMTGDQLQQALDELGWSIKDASHYFDQDRRRVQEWLRGYQRIPRWVPVLLALVAAPGGPARLRAVDQHLLLQQHEQTGGNPQC